MLQKSYEKSKLTVDGYSSENFLEADATWSFGFIYLQMVGVSAKFYEIFCNVRAINFFSWNFTKEVSSCLPANNIKEWREQKARTWPECRQLPSKPQPKNSDCRKSESFLL